MQGASLEITSKQEMSFPDVHIALWPMPLCHCHQHWMFTVQRKALQWPFMSTQTLSLSSSSSVISLFLSLRSVQT